MANDKKFIVKNGLATTNNVIIGSLTDSENGKLQVTGNTVITGSASITQSVTANNVIATNNVQASNAAITYDLTVGRNAIIQGNLTVQGTTTTINTETILLADNIITLNSNYTGSTPTENAGFEVERGTLDNALLQWNETNDYWEIAVGGVTGRIITTGDEGSGNGFDADLLDGLDSTQFLRSDVDDIANGNITILGDLTVGNNVGGAQIIFNGSGQDRTVYSDNGQIGFLNASLNYAAYSDASGNWIVQTDVTAGGNVSAANNVLATNNVQAGKNVTANNVITTNDVQAGRDVSAANNVSAANTVLATNNVQAGKNVTANNVITTNDVQAGRDVTATRNVSASNNVSAANTVSATIDVIAGRNVSASNNVSAANTVSATVDVIAGRNVSAANNVLATNNVQAGKNVTANNVITTNDVQAGRDVTAGRNISATANVVAGIDVIAGNDVIATNDIIANNATITNDLTVDDIFAQDIITQTINSNSAIIGDITANNIVVDQDVQASRFVDRNDTTYYADPASSSRLNDISLVGEIIHDGDTDTYLEFNAADSFRVVTGGTARLTVNNTAVTVSHRVDAPIFYDSNDTAYYFDGSNATTSLTAAGKVLIGNVTDADRTNDSTGTGGVTIASHASIAAGQNATIQISGSNGNYPLFALNRIDVGNNPYANSNRFIQFYSDGNAKSKLSTDTPGNLYLILGAGLQNGTWDSNGNGLLVVDEGGDVIVGDSSATYSTSDANTTFISAPDTNKLHVNGSIQLNGVNNILSLYVADGSNTAINEATFLAVNELGFSAGGGFYMDETTTIKVRNNKTISSSGDAVFARFVDYNNNTYLVDPAGTSVVNDISLEGEIIHNGDTNTYLEFNAADSFRVVTGGAERLLVNNTYVLANNQMRSPIYYDSANTSYYGDFAGTSVLQDLNVYSNAATGNLNVGRNVNERIRLHVTDSVGYLQYWQDETDTTDHSFRFEILSSSTGTNRFEFNKPIALTGTVKDIYASRYYDADDNNYYADPANGSYLAFTSLYGYHQATATDYTALTTPAYKVTSVGSSTYWRATHLSDDTTVSGVYNYQTGKDVYWGEPADTGVYYFRGRYVQADASVRSPIFYDSNDTNYYGNFASKSRMLEIGLGTGDVLLRRPTGTYGSLEVDGGAVGSWEGYSIGGRVVFMHDNANRVGVYNDVDNEWIWYADLNNSMRLMYNNVEQASTENGYFLATNQIRSPIFYDSNDTNYYVNPASSSVMNDLTLTTLTLGGYLQNRPVAGRWYEQGTYSYGGSPATMQFYYILIAQLAVNSSKGFVEYYAKSDANYSTNFVGRIVLGSYNSQSMSVDHHAIGGPENGVKPEVYVDASRQVWIRVTGNQWDSTFRWHWIQSDNITVYDGSTRQLTAPANLSAAILPGYQIRFPSVSAVTGTPTTTRNFVGNLTAYGDARAQIFYDNDDTNYYFNPAGDRAATIGGRIYRQNFTNNSGSSNYFLEAQDLNHWIWSIATNWGIFWATDGTPAYSYFSSGNANEIVYVGNGNVRASIDLDNGNAFFGGQVYASNYNILGGNESISVNPAYGSGGADLVLFDMTPYFEARVVNALQGVENALTGTTSEYTKSTDGPFAGSYVLRTSAYRDFDSDYIPVSPGEEIYGEVSVKTISGSGGLLYMGVRRYDKDKRPITSNDGITYFVVSAANVTSTSWVTYRGHTTIPATHTPYNGSDGAACRFVRLILLVNYNTGGALREIGGVMLKRRNAESNLLVDDLQALDRIDAGGIIQSSASVRAPIFYDTNDTAYYADPASGSLFGSLNLRTGGLKLERAYASNSIWFNAGTDTNHVLWNAYNGNDPITRGGAGTGFDGILWNVFRGIQIRGGSAGAYNLIVAANDAGVNNTHTVELYANNVKQFETESGYALATNQIRSPIFYDSNDTAYYADPNGTSNFSRLNVAGRQVGGYVAVDMRSLNINTYYPVTIPVPVGRTARIRIENALTGQSVPSWSTHPAGFSIYLEWVVNGNGWGTIATHRRVVDYREAWTSVTICGGLTQMTQSSTEVVWLRGGGYYNFSADFDLSATIQTGTYTINGQSVAPSASVQNSPYDTTDGTMSYGAFYARSQMRSPIYYDYDNTAYYINPAGGPRAGYLDGNLWINPKPESYGEGVTFYMPTQATWGGLRWYRTSNFSAGAGNWAFGYFGNESNNDIGFHNGNNGWRLDHSFNNTITGSVRSPIFYDSNDTNYYGDFASTSRFNDVLSNNVRLPQNPVGTTYGGGQTATPPYMFSQGVGDNDGWRIYGEAAATNQVRMVFELIDDIETAYEDQWVFRNKQTYGSYTATSPFYVSGGGNVYGSASMRSPIFYDLNNTGYYVDPNNFSNIYDLQVRSGGAYANLSDLGYVSPIQISETQTGTFAARFIPMISQRSVSPPGYRQHTVFGSYRDYAWGSAFIAVGGNDNYPTTAFYFNYQGIFTAPASVRAPIFYDTDNTAYYVDPAGTSNLNGLIVGGRYVQGKSGDVGTSVTATGWYTIASYGNGRCEDTLVISDPDSSRHNFVKVHIVWSYGNGGITVVQSGRYSVSTIRHIRLMYNTSDQTYGGVRVQVYCENPNWTMYVHSEGQGAPGWGVLNIYGTAVREDPPSGFAQYTRIDGINDNGRLATSGYITSQTEVYGFGSVRAPIFYDYNDTGYYLDPNSTSASALRIRGGTLHGPNPSWGKYLLVGGDGRQNRIDDSNVASVCTTNGNLHIDAASGFNTYINYYDGSVIYFGGGANNTWGEFSGGVFYAYSQARSPIFYDYNDTGYYVDPNSASQLREVYANNWFRPQGDTGVYWQSYDTRIFSDNSAYLKTRSDNGLVIYDRSANLRGYLYFDSSGYGLLNSSGTWQVRIEPGNANMELYRITYMNDARAYIYYDRNDTGYYVDPNGTSNLNVVNAQSHNFTYINYLGRISAEIGRSTHRGGIYTYGTYTAGNAGGNPPLSYPEVIAWGNGGGGTIQIAGDWINTDSTPLRVRSLRDCCQNWSSWTQIATSGESFTNNVDLRAPIFYDSNNTGYYIDPTSDSNWNGLTNYGKMRIGQTAKGNFRRNDYTGDTNYWVGSMGWGTTDLISVFTWGSGFFDTWGNPANQPAGTSHWTGVQALHYVSGYNSGYGWQLVGGPISGAWWTSYWASKRPWYKIAMYGLNEYSNDFYATIMYDSNNTGYYCDPNGTSRMATIQPNIGYLSPHSGGDSGIPRSSYPYGAVFQNGDGWNFPYPDLVLQYHTGVLLAANPSYDGISFYNDYNDGTLRFRVNGGSGYTYKYTWMYTNTTGFYSDTNSAHIYPNNLTYGSWRVDGNRNGWAGFCIYDPSGYRNHVMFETGNGGFYNQDTGVWAHYYSRGNACVGIMTSTTSSSYHLYVPSKGIYSEGNVVAYSDIRKKENVVTVDNALEKVLQLRGVYYNRIDDESKKRQVGVIAQEVVEVLPEVVTYAEDIDEYGVSYGNFAGLLIEGIKEQQALINRQQEEINELKALVKQLMEKL